MAIVTVLGLGAALAPAASASSARAPVVYSGTRGWHVTSNGRPHYMVLDHLKFHGHAATYLTRVSWFRNDAATGTYHSVQTGTRWHVRGHVTMSNIKRHDGVRYYKHLNFTFGTYKVNSTWRDGNWHFTSSQAVLTAMSSASQTPFAYGVPYGSRSGGSNFVHAKIRPTGKLYWTGDGSAWFSRMRWQSWSSSGARGSARMHARVCWGNCFRYKTEHTALHFYRVRTHRGHPYFTRLHFSLRHKLAGAGGATLRFYRHGLAWYYATAAANAPAASASSRTPVVYGMPSGNLNGGSNFRHGKVDPTGLLLWSVDGSAFFRIHSWSANVASATVSLRSCWESCDRHKTEHAALRFYRVRTHRGHRYYTRIHFTLRHKLAGLKSATPRFFTTGVPGWGDVG